MHTRTHTQAHVTTKGGGQGHLARVEFSRLNSDPQAWLQMPPDFYFHVAVVYLNSTYEGKGGTCLSESGLLYDTLQIHPFSCK